VNLSNATVMPWRSHWSKGEHWNAYERCNHSIFLEQY
jgi:hypothetical protein